MVSTGMDMNKDFLLNESKTFCVFPWNHLHVTPIGTAAPCCIAESCSNHEGMGDAKSNRLMDLVNSPKMKQLRLDMLNGVESEECKKCYQHEKANIPSFRQEGLRLYPETVEDAINTNEDGSVSEFNMRYFDMRFSNLCNFKCRTCGQEYSSQWELENHKNNIPYALTFPKGANKELLQDVVDQVSNFKKAYFAGGEPLIMEEHYLLLEEMIRQDRTDVALVYNSNISNLNYKNKDLLGLWKHFKKHVQVYASVDHVKERAEYIRHGTDWATIEKNIIELRQHDFVKMTYNTVLSIFNILTIDQFYGYLVANNLYTNTDLAVSLYCMSSPTYLSCHSMPNKFKDLGNNSIDRAVHMFKVNNFMPSKVEYVAQAKNWAHSQDIWDEVNHTGNKNKISFRQEIERLDKIRGEKFENVFPELIPLMELTHE